MFYSKINYSQKKGILLKSLFFFVLFNNLFYKTVSAGYLFFQHGCGF